MTTGYVVMVMVSLWFPLRAWMGGKIG
ncbi:hypothetical protein COSMO_150 [Mycobacterium phage Cosmo]|uniref:Uncharacterized protein n=1 Tax=Mycobacterium phage Cosmo TaxID=1567467 RepID=A0A0B4ZXU3_9CAUD|nr:hypothetical protein COSMO_150 [Mycobacterium phage Cosmo]